MIRAFPLLPQISRHCNSLTRQQLLSTTTTMTTPLRIGMIGGGTVGGGVYEIIMRRGLPTLPRPVEIVKICVRSLDKPRDFELDKNKTELVTDPSSILDDDSINCVVEVMGGTTLAKDIVLKALKSGKSVVTANKALLASCMSELQQAAVDSKQQLCYEAAVCGGIPIIHILQSGNCYSGDVISSISGIMNGTTNFMLTNMENGQDYDKVLAQAQALGYAEADPTADVEGHDVCAKLAILTKLAFGETVSMDQIPTTGISQIKKVDFIIAKQLHCTIKLVGTAKRLRGNKEDAICVFVSPVMMSFSNALAHAKGSGNAVAVTSRNMGTCLYTGPGAGRFPTANSVVADIVRLASNDVNIDPFPQPSVDFKLETDYTAQFYIRLPCAPGHRSIVRRIGQHAEECEIIIASLMQPEGENGTDNVCLTTHLCPVSAVQKFCKDFKEKEAELCRGEPVFMPLEL